jgi:uncharacterized repeat protein (TIGR02543 family)
MILTSAMPAFATNVSLTDVEGHWAKETIQTAVESGLITGYADGTFKPNNTISRAEFFTLVNRGYKFTKTVANQYADVPETAWYAKEIEKATAAGYINVEAGGMVEPTRAITREEAAKIIATVEGLYAASLEQKFSDGQTAYAGNQNAIIAVNEAKIMNGYPTGEFKPKGNITRAEAIVTLSKSMAYEAQENFVYNEAKTYGNEASQTVVDGNVIVTKSGANLKNLVINGNLTIGSQVAEGNVVLQDVEVKGATIVNGGGINSIYFNDVKLNTVYVDKALRAVRLVATGDTTIQDVVARTKVELQEKNLLGKAAGFNNVLVEENVVGGTNTGVTLHAGLLSSVDIKGEGINLVLGNSARVSNLNIEGAKAKVLGNGLVMSATVKAELASFAKKPVKMEVATGVAAPSIKTTASTSSSGGSSSGGGGGSSSGGSSSGGTTTPTYINTPSALANAIQNGANATVTLQGNITGDVVANRTAGGNLTINFNGYSVNGDLDITADKASAITLNGTDAAKISGDIILDAKNASVTNNVAVDGKAVVENVAYHSYKANKAHGKGIDVKGRAKIVVAPLTKIIVNIKSDYPVVLAGDVEELNVEAPGASAIVEGRINKVNVRKGAKAAEIQVADNAEVKNLKADEPVIVLAENIEKLNINIDSTGSATVTKEVAHLVHFDENGGDLAAQPDFVYVKAGTVLGFLPSTPVKAGFVFNGWNTDAQGGGTVVTEATIVSAGVTYYAQWEAVPVNTYVVTFESNGGTFVAPISGIEANGKITLPSDPDKSEYSFEGWYTDDVTFTIPFTEGYTVSKDMTVYAKWVKPICNVYFESNDGSSVDNQTVAPGGTITVPAEPTREGYTFAGWYADYDLTQAFIATTKLTSDITLYAKWTPVSDKTFTVTFMNGTETVGTQTVPENAKVVEPSEPSKAGYTFVGWYTDAALTSDFVWKTTITKDMTLYAKWEVVLNEYTVVFMDGQTKLAEQKVVENGTADLSIAPNKTGLEFLGWYTDADFKTGFDKTSKVTSDITLYARYAVAEYQVFFEVDGGSFVPSLFVIHGEKAMEPTVAPTKESYEFMGWYTERECINAFDWNTPIMKDTELFAKWEVKYTVTFSDGTENIGTKQVINNTVVSDLVAPIIANREFVAFYDDNQFTNALDGATKIDGNRTIYVKYDTVCIITFDTGNGPAIDPIKIINGVEPTDMKLPDYPGYKFAGVYEEPEFINLIDKNNKPTYDHDMTWYIKWVKVYTVTFMDDAVTLEVNTVTKGEKVEVITAPIKDGYHFTAWYTDAALTVLFDKNEPVTSDVILYAKYEPNTTPVTEFTVTFDAGAGVTAPASVKVTSGASVQTLPTVSKDGFSFDGWFKADGTEFTIMTQVTADTTVVAKWTPNVVEYVVKFIYSGAEMFTQKVEKDAIIPNIDALAPIKLGHTFIGWYTDAALTSVYANAGVTGDMDLYAKYEPDTTPVTEFTVTFDPGAGVTAPASVTVTSGASVQTLPTVSKDGFTFDGWFKADGTEFTTATQVTADLTVVAKWTETVVPVTEFNVTFMNGTTTAATIVTTSGGTVTVPADPTQGPGPSYVFKGWFKTDAYLEAFTGTTAVLEDTTVYAGWTSPGATCTVTFDYGTTSGSATRTTTSGGTVTLPAPAVDGSKVFSGWFVENGLIDVELDGNSIIYTDITVTPRWDLE